MNKISSTLGLTKGLELRLGPPIKSGEHLQMLPWVGATVTVLAVAYSTVLAVAYLTLLC